MFCSSRASAPRAHRPIGQVLQVLGAVLRFGQMQVVYREGPGGRVFCFLKNPGPDARRARTVLSRKKTLLLVPPYILLFSFFRDALNQKGHLKGTKNTRKITKSSKRKQFRLFSRPYNMASLRFNLYG